MVGLPGTEAQGQIAEVVILEGSPWRGGPANGGADRALVARHAAYGRETPHQGAGLLDLIRTGRRPHRRGGRKDENQGRRPPTFHTPETCHELPAPPRAARAAVVNRRADR